MAAIEDKPALSAYKLSSSTIFGIAFISAFYFADISLKASRKCFWFDELFTLYLCRLPSFKTTWAAVTHGADFNPPLFYLLTRGAQRLFGEGLIATRLPAMVGVWLFCICLFFFVARRAGVLSGFIAGAFPFFTLAQYYSYEARAHGIVLGWCGLALVCWQRTKDGRAKYLWLAGFGLSLMGALLTHVYAVYLVIPFAVVELYNLLKRGQLDWGVAGVLVLSPALVIVTVYVPLFRAYRTSMPTSYFPASHDLIGRFLSNAFGPGVIIFLIWLALSALHGMRPGPYTRASIPDREMLLAGGFACIPVLGLIGCKFSHGPFLDRYFLSSIAGYAIFLGFASSRWQVALWTTKVMAGCMFLLMLADLGSTIYLCAKHRIVLIEPSSGFALSTTPSNPMALYHDVAMNTNGLDILVLRNIEYLYFFRYAPPFVVPHLYFGASANDVFLAAYEKLAKQTSNALKITTFGPFFASHDHFLLYESGSPNIDAIQGIASYGYKLKSARSDGAGIMYEYTK